MNVSAITDRAVKALASNGYESDASRIREALEKLSPDDIALLFARGARLAAKDGPEGFALLSEDESSEALAARVLTRDW